MTLTFQIAGKGLCLTHLYANNHNDVVVCTRPILTWPIHVSLDQHFIIMANPYRIYGLVAKTSQQVVTLTLKIGDKFVVTHLHVKGNNLVNP